MQLRELYKYLNIPSEDVRQIKEVVISTQDVVDGCVLVLTKGHKINPLNLLNENIRKKCLLILCDEPFKGCLYIPNLKDRVFEILDYVYFRHEHPFKMIGITGTEGKSSFCDIITQSLKILNFRPLKISNNNHSYDNFQSELTTPNPKDIIEAMLRAKKEKKTHFIMELSCIGLSEKRVDVTYFDDLFLTNLETDHLDYYKNIFEYHKSKISAFQKSKKSRKYIFETTYKKYPNLFSKCSNLHIIKDQDIKIKNSSLSHQVFYYKNEAFYTHLVFAQNRKNLAMLLEFYDQKNINLKKKIIQKIKRVKGRLDLIHSRPYIMIDYAHSSKSVESVLKELSAFKQNRLIVVIGAGGNRDITKRKIYGDMCAKYADITIITNDNPRDEDPLKIANDIRGNHTLFMIELNRKKAINQACNLAKEDDIVAILGRGNEEYQHIGQRKVISNDYEEAMKCLSK